VLPDLEIDRRLAVATAVAREAGAVARRWFERRRELVVEHKGRQDFVSEADREVEALIRERLASALPEDGFFGEESGGAPGESFWAVDPIDGTTNFLRGIPLYAVSLAFVHQRETLVGAVYVPPTDRMFQGVRGRGAEVDGRPLRVSGCAVLEDALVGIGSSLRVAPASLADVFRELYLWPADLRRLGSAAVALAFVADGTLDAFFEAHLSPWDALAGLLLVREAGGWTSDFTAGDGLARGNAVLACAPALQAELARITRVRA
jgi:myo-inositol-1(or 4)-monophosphatase